MQKKTILLSIVGLIIVVGTGWAYSNWKTYAPTMYVQEKVEADGTTTVTTVNTETGTTTSGSPVFTFAEVATHKDATSCYTVISGKVYDLTLWINLHPGGKTPILSICGIDGTERFMAKHKGAQKQMDILARFYIGNLSI